MENKKLYENYLQELGFDDVKFIYNKIPDPAKRAAIDAGKHIGVITASYLAYKVFSTFLNKCHETCHNEKGLSFGEEKLCYLTCRMKALEQQIVLLQKYIRECHKAPNPKACESKVRERIEKLQVTLRKTISKRDQIRLSLMQKGRNLEPGERKFGEKK